MKTALTFALPFFILPLLSTTQALSNNLNFNAPQIAPPPNINVLPIPRAHHAIPRADHWGAGDRFTDWRSDLADNALPDWFRAHAPDLDRVQVLRELNAIFNDPTHGQYAVDPTGMREAAGEDAPFDRGIGRDDVAAAEQEEGYLSDGQRHDGPGRPNGPPAASGQAEGGDGPSPSWAGQNWSTNVSYREGRSRADGSPSYTEVRVSTRPNSSGGRDARVVMNYEDGSSVGASGSTDASGNVTTRTKTYVAAANDRGYRHWVKTEVDPETGEETVVEGGRFYDPNNDGVPDEPPAEDSQPNETNTAGTDNCAWRWWGCTETASAFNPLDLVSQPIPASEDSSTDRGSGGPQIGAEAVTNTGGADWGSDGTRAGGSGGPGLDPCIRHNDCGGPDDPGGPVGPEG